MKNLSKIFILVFIGLLGFSPLSGYSQLMEDYPTMDQLIGTKAKDFTLASLEGKAVKYSDLVKEGEKAIVFFWATWCPHCREALDEFNSHADQYKLKNIKIIFVDVGEKPEIVKQYAQKNNTQFEVLLDTDYQLVLSYGFTGVPAFVLIDAKGIVKDAQNQLPQNYEEILSST